jgi:D-alanyl-D-alanine carboxypeptidase
MVIFMKKKLLVCVFAMVITLGGCQVSSNGFLSFEDTSVFAGHSTDNRLTQSSFFAEDLAIIQKVEAIGDDEKLTAGASLLVNTSDKEILYADNIYDKLYPASLTKLLTALVVLRYGEMTDSVSISYNASHISEVGAKLCGYAEGDVLTLEALLNSLLIYSGNDAAIAIADHVAGSEEAFVKRMNEEAIKIGAVHSNFINSNGLHDDNQYTTAYDMYLIFHELMKYDSIRSIISTDSYTAIYTDKDGNAKEKTMDTTNLYVRGEAETPKGILIVGGKTGTTNKAGNCLILLSTDDADKEYISIILKASDNNELYSQMSHILSFVEVE